MIVNLLASLLLNFLFCQKTVFSLLVNPDADGNFRIRQNAKYSQLNFTVIGDWGGFPKPFYNTPIQLSAAEMMGKISDRDDGQFTLALGDNFYFWGVKNINDPHFSKTFNDVYTAQTLQRFWYPIAGNHDWQGSVPVQFEYSSVNYRWTYPNFYYTVEYTLNDSPTNPTKVRILMFDTQMHCDQSSTDMNKQYPVFPTLQQKADQLQWLEDELEDANNNKIEYLFVAGHYQIQSPWKAYSCMQDVDQMLKKYQVSAYLSGHIHQTNHLVATDGSNFNYICSGIGALMEAKKGPPSNDNIEAKYEFYQIKGFKGGFLLANIDSDEAAFNFYYAGDGDTMEPQYTARILPRNFG